MMSNLHLILRHLQKQLKMTDSEFYWLLELMNHKRIITTTDIVNNRIKEHSNEDINKIRI